MTLRDFSWPDALTVCMQPRRARRTALAQRAGCGARGSRNASGSITAAQIRARCVTRRPISTRIRLRRAARQGFVDPDEDLTLEDLANAAQEGFDSVELLTRYSTVGMGPSQGKLSNIAAARHLEARASRGGAPLGLTTARPP